MMTFALLAIIFAFSILLSAVMLTAVITRPPIFIGYQKPIFMFLLAWFTPYFLFITFFCGPRDLARYPTTPSTYKLPWKAGVTRLVAQGNRSFTSHRDYHEYAWDFVMPNGTEIFAARAGRVFSIDQDFDGIGLHSNFIVIEHDDGERSGYAHIQYRSALVKVGDLVTQGQPIALSGMVGETIFPHVHFYVTDSRGVGSIPITFADVTGQGIPFAGHFYTSGNVP